MVILKLWRVSMLMYSSFVRARHVVKSIYKLRTKAFWLFVIRRLFFLSTFSMADCFVSQFSFVIIMKVTTTPAAHLVFTNLAYCSPSDLSVSPAPTSTSSSPTSLTSTMKSLYPINISKLKLGNLVFKTQKKKFEKLYKIATSTVLFWNLCQAATC